MCVIHVILCEWVNIVGCLKERGKIQLRNISIYKSICSFFKIHISYELFVDSSYVCTTCIFIYIQMSMLYECIYAYYIWTSVKYVFMRIYSRTLRVCSVARTCVIHLCALIDSWAKVNWVSNIV